jgi:hypothetical protein
MKNAGSGLQIKIKIQGVSKFANSKESEDDKLLEPVLAVANKNKNTGCLKIREFRSQSVVGKDPVELEKYFGKKFALPEEDIIKHFNFVQYIAALIFTVTKYYSNYVPVSFLREIKNIYDFFTPK